MESTTCFGAASCPIGACPGFFGLILALVLIDLVLKGFALWRAAGNKHIFWFILLLIINTAGILPLIYLLLVGKKKDEKSET